VELHRRFTDAVEFLREKLKEGGRNTGVAEIIAQALREEFKVLVNNGISRVYSGNRDFAEFLTDFLMGKPFWLENE
jgi:hypothetical protein